MKKNKQIKHKKKKEFSKVLIGQESALIWVMTIAFIVLAFVCVIKQYFSELPWIVPMIGFPWSAYGVSQAFYYNKAKKENVIKLEKYFDPNYNAEEAQQESGKDESCEDTEGAVG